MRTHLVALLCLAGGLAKRPAPEEADVPSPRTAWSGTPRFRRQWTACQKRMVEAAGLYVQAPADEHRLVLLGDSITESWRGASICVQMPRARAVPDVLARTLAARWPSPVVLGIGGDMTQHVLWRLSEGGELTPTMAADPRLVTVVLIGTNNLGRGHDATQTVAGVVAVARHLLEHTRGKVVLNALFPRGDGAKRSHAPMTADPAGGPPRRTFLPLIARVNAALNASASGALAKAFPGRLSYVDCSAVYFSRRPNADEEVKVRLMPDKLHPNALGHKIWAECLNDAIARAVGEDPKIGKDIESLQSWATAKS